MNELELATRDWISVVIAAAIVLGTIWFGARMLQVRATDVARGTDGRGSTSKFQAALWTGLVAWALLSLIIGSILGDVQDSALSIGWDVFNGEREADGTRLADPRGDTMEEDYLWLLGIPAATAVVAKAAVTTKVANGTITKTAKEPAAKGGLLETTRELISDDSGRPAILDLQLVVFNVLLAIYFVGAFMNDPNEGLPRLPDTLLVLAGVSNGGYAANKALERTTGPAISSVRPSRIVLGPHVTEVTIYGGPFAPVAVGEHPPPPDLAGVKLDGVPLEIVDRAGDHLTALVPASDNATALGLKPGRVELVAIDHQGVPAEPQPVDLVEPDPVADAASDDRLPDSAVAEIDAEVARLVGDTFDEELETAATEAADGEPGTSHLPEETLVPDDPEEVI